MLDPPQDEIGSRPGSGGPERSSLPVVVVGAGPTGLVAASLLATYGVPSLVLERFEDAYPMPRAVHVDDEVVRILQRIGVAAQFQAVSRPALGMRLVDARHRVLAEFRREPEGRHGYPQANLFDQPDLERLLREGLAGRPEAHLVGGSEVLMVEQVGAGRPGGGPAAAPAAVRVTVRDVATGRRRVVLAQAVLGCDGAHSVIRQAVGARLDDLHFEERWLVLDVRCDTDLGRWDGVHQVCDPRRAATFMRIGGLRYRWEFRLHDGETAAELTAPARLAGLLAPWLGELSLADVEVVRAAEYTFRAKVADRWSRGRVFLLGDAAHLTPPFIGQGLAAGLRDAANLAWKLALVLRHGADERLLGTYELERKPHARRMIRLAVATGWALTGGQDRAAAVRRFALARLCQIPWTRDRLSDATVSPLPAGPLVGRRPRPGHRGDRLAGETCPQPWVSAPGRQRLDDVLGPGFALVTDGPAGQDMLDLARRLDACVVQVGAADGAADTVVTGAASLRSWLRKGHAGAVLLRPDRAVLVSARPGRPGAATRPTGTGPPGLTWLPGH